METKQDNRIGLERLAYERRERLEFFKWLKGVEDTPRRDRREAAQAFEQQAKLDQAFIGARIGWLLEGVYGLGPMLVAREVCQNTRMNRQSWLVQTIAAIEWGCPSAWTRKIWHKLDLVQKEALQTAVNKEIEAYIDSLKGETKWNLNASSKT